MGGAQKAYVGAAVAAVVAFLSALSGALGEGGTFGDLDTQTWINAVLAALVASGVTGGTVYGVKNSDALEE
jgi:hypothetical protein